MIKRNINLLKWDNFFAGAFPLAGLLVVYFQQITQSYAYAMGLLSVSFIMQALCEVPAGVFSDKMGRKKSLLLSIGLFLLVAVLWAMAGTFSSVLCIFIGSVIFGISDAFLSGTDEAFMYETVVQLKKKDDFKAVFANTRMFNQIGLCIGAIIAIIITYFYDLVVLAWVSIVPIFISFMLTCFYVEPDKNKKSFNKNTSIAHFVCAFKELCVNKRLRFYGFIYMIDSAIKITFIRFEMAYFATLLPLWMVNIVRFFKKISGIWGYFIAARIRKISVIHQFFSSLFAALFIQWGGILLNNLFTPFIMGASDIFVGITDTARAHILQNEISAQQRATMISIMALFSKIMSAILMIGIGAIADYSAPFYAIGTLLIGKSVLMLFSYLYVRKS